jgi:hypothetical protein
MPTATCDIRFSLQNRYAETSLVNELVRFGISNRAVTISGRARRSEKEICGPKKVDSSASQSISIRSNAISIVSTTLDLQCGSADGQFNPTVIDDAGGSGSLRPESSSPSSVTAKGKPELLEYKLCQNCVRNSSVDPIGVVLRARVDSPNGWKHRSLVTTFRLLDGSCRHANKSPNAAEPPMSQSSETLTPIAATVIPMGQRRDSR